MKAENPKPTKLQPNCWLAYHLTMAQFPANDYAKAGGDSDDEDEEDDADDNSAYMTNQLQ